MGSRSIAFQDELRSAAVGLCDVQTAASVANYMPVLEVSGISILDYVGRG